MSGGTPAASIRSTNSERLETGVKAADSASRAQNWSSNARDPAQSAKHYNEQSTSWFERRLAIAKSGTAAQSIEAGDK